MPPQTYQLPVPGKPGSRPRTAGTPYAVTALLLDDIKRTGHEAAGVVRTTAGKVERRTWPKENMARFAAKLTHAFIVTAAPLSWAAGISCAGVKALNPDVAETGSEAGLFSVPAGQLPE